jgi:hypothetical protein
LIDSEVCSWPVSHRWIVLVLLAGMYAGLHLYISIAQLWFNRVMPLLMASGVMLIFKSLLH